MAFAFIAIEPNLRLDRLSPLHVGDIPISWPRDRMLGVIEDGQPATIARTSDLYHAYPRKIGGHVVRVWTVRDPSAFPASTWEQIEARVHGENPRLIEEIAPFSFGGHEVKAFIDESGGAMVAPGGRARLTYPAWQVVWKGGVYSIGGISEAEGEHDIRKRVLACLRAKSAIDA